MKFVALLMACFSFSSGLCAQEIYSKSFGNPQHTACIYLHGGPGYNAANFEATTAQALANQGFFVIVYDRRGEGRSIDSDAAYTFEQTFEDLNGLYAKYQLTKAVLVGHSFGGIVATLYAKAFPNKVKSMVYVGAPFALQRTFSSILTRAKKIYQEKNDSLNLKAINALERLDTSSVAYGSYCFYHAMQNGFYSANHLNVKAQDLYATFRTDSLLVRHAAKMSPEAPMGFWKNEHYTTLDLLDELKALKESGLPVFGLYGKEDGLFSPDQINALTSIIGAKHFQYLDNCSHNVFIDQQVAFINALTTWTK